MAKVQTDFNDDLMDFLKIEKVKRRKNNIPDTLISCVKELEDIKVKKHIDRAITTSDVLREVDSYKQKDKYLFTKDELESVINYSFQIIADAYDLTLDNNNKNNIFK